MNQTVPVKYKPQRTIAAADVAESLETTLRLIRAALDKELRCCDDTDITEREQNVVFGQTLGLSYALGVVEQTARSLGVYKEA